MGFHIISEIVLGIVSFFVLSMLKHNTQLGVSHLQLSYFTSSNTTLLSFVWNLSIGSVQGGGEEVRRKKEREERKKEISFLFFPTISHTVTVCSVTQLSLKSRPDNQIAVCFIWEPLPRCVCGFSCVCDAVCVGELQGNLLTIYVVSPG